MEGGKSGPEKNYYFLLPNNRSIQVGAQYSTTCGSKDDRKQKIFWLTKGLCTILLQQIKERIT